MVTIMTLMRIVTEVIFCPVGRALRPFIRGWQGPGKARGHPEMRSIGEGDIKVQCVRFS